MKIRNAIVVLALAGLAGSAQAETYNFTFGTWLGDTPSFQPTVSFASLAVSTTDHKTFTFDLTAFSNLDTVFGTGAKQTFISEAIFNDFSGNDPKTNSIVSGSWGVTNVKLQTTAPQVGSVGFDFGEKFCGGSGCNTGNYAQNRLTAGEEVKWTSTFKNAQPDPFFGLPPVALHVQGFNVEIDGEGRCSETTEITSGWYTPTTVAPVPEPETYAMMLAGLGLLGVAARRRKQKLVA